MNFNFQKARDLMVENQLRPNKINSKMILGLFKNTKKEDFLSEDKKNFSYSDLDITIEKKRGYLKNLHIAQLINYSEINDDSKILHLGGLTGYVSAILAKLCKKIVIIENNINLLNQLNNNLQKLQISNAEVINRPFSEGYKNDSPYDIIFIDNPILELNISLKQQLNHESGKAIMIKKITDDLSKAFKIIKSDNTFTYQYLFDVFTNYELYNEERGFNF